MWAIFIEMCNACYIYIKKKKKRITKKFQPPTQEERWSRLYSLVFPVVQSVGPEVYKQTISI